MKKIFSSFVLIMFFIVVFFENTMMIFAMQNTSMDMNMEITSAECCDEDNNCEHECCYSSNGFVNITSLNTTRENTKKLKVKLKQFVDLISFSIKSLEQKNLVKNTSPPELKRDIKNYSYKDLTKIIKSNI